MIAGKAVQTFGMELEKHQQLILAAAEILIEIYMAESALLKAEKVAEMTTEEASSRAGSHGKTQPFQRRKYYKATKGKEAIVYVAEGDEQRMMLDGLETLHQVH